MADINIERKERNPWPWIIVGIVVLALIIWWVATRPADRDTAVLPPAADPTVTQPSPEAVRQDGAVADFLQFSDAGRTAGEMGVDHNYTADGIRRLAAALEQLDAQRATREAVVAERLPVMRNFADSLQADAAAARHANQARSAFAIGADVMAALQRATPAAQAQVGRVRQSAEAIEPAVPLLEQRQRVRTYFDRAADAVRALQQSS